MEIEALSMAMNQTKLQTDVQTAILAKTIDVVNAESEAMTKMMEMSVNPELGANLDIRV